MTISVSANMYESEQLRDITGTTIRPGGFALTEKAAELCRLEKGARVLDIGCGVGATVEYLKMVHEIDAFGIDISTSLLHQGRRRFPDLAVVCGNASALPLADSVFQAVFCECVLSLTPDPASVLEEISRVLLPGGFLIVTDIYQRVPIILPRNNSLSLNCCLRGAVGKDRIQSLINENGFTLMLWEDHTNLLKILTAKLVFAYGSVEKFRSSFCDCQQSSAMINRICDMKPGYYFLTAKKSQSADIMTPGNELMHRLYETFHDPAPTLPIADR